MGRPLHAQGTIGGGPLGCGSGDNAAGDDSGGQFPQLCHGPLSQALRSRGRTRQVPPAKPFSQRGALGPASLLCRARAAPCGQAVAQPGLGATHTPGWPKPQRPGTNPRASRLGEAGWRSEGLMGSGITMDWGAWQRRTAQGFPTPALGPLVTSPPKTPFPHLNPSPRQSSEGSGDGLIPAHRIHTGRLWVTGIAPGG